MTLISFSLSCFDRRYWNMFAKQKIGALHAIEKILEEKYFSNFEHENRNNLIPIKGRTFIISFSYIFLLV